MQAPPIAMGSLTGSQVPMQQPPSQDVTAQLPDTHWPPSEQAPPAATVPLNIRVHDGSVGIALCPLNVHGAVTNVRRNARHWLAAAPSNVRLPVSRSAMTCGIPAVRDAMQAALSE